MVDDMSIHRASGVFGLHRDTVRKLLKYAAPPGYQRRKPPRRPEIGAYTAVIEQILQDDLNVPREQRHNAKRISLHYLRGADRRQVCLSSHN